MIKQFAALLIALLIALIVALPAPSNVDRAALRWGAPGNPAGTTTTADACEDWAISIGAKHVVFIDDSHESTAPPEGEIFIYGIDENAGTVTFMHS